MRAALLVLALVPGCALIDSLGAVCDAPPQLVPVNQTVPDDNPAGLSSSTTAGPGTVSGVTVSADTSHAYPRELVYTLTHGGYMVVLDDNGENDVTGFDGLDAGGPWTMNVHDDTTADEGFWTSWQLAVCIE